MTAPILILTTEPLPVAGLPTTGAGLRAWGLAQGLRHAGLEVKAMFPREALASYAGAASAPALPEWIETFDRRELNAAVRRLAPAVVVLQHWGLARDLGEVEAPLAIDLAGPHLLERKLWGSADAEADLAEKLSALRRADFATASGERQRLYFLPYLAMAGWDLSAEGLLPVIPFGVQPAAPPAPPRSDRLIYGGFFLPWQDPTLCLETALDALDAAGRGELIFIGGAHPTADVSRGRFEPLVRRLAAHPRVRMHGPMDFAAYSALLAEGGVALDLMARNAERELAFTTRTAVYLGHGLPVLHDNYSELGEWIAAAGAGWALDPRDRAGVRAVLDSILNNAADLPARGAAAHRLACERLDWNAIAGPLIDFCRNPRRREGKVIGELALESGVRRRREQQAELEHTRGELASLRGKRWVRWGLAATSARAWLRWPAALLALLIAIPLFPVLCLLAFRARKPP